MDLLRAYTNVFAILCNFVSEWSWDSSDIFMMFRKAMVLLGNRETDLETLKYYEYVRV